MRHDRTYLAVGRHLPLFLLSVFQTCMVLHFSLLTLKFMRCQLSFGYTRVFFFVGGGGDATKRVLFVPSAEYLCLWWEENFVASYQLYDLHRESRHYSRSPLPLFLLAEHVILLATCFCWCFLCSVYVIHDEIKDKDFELELSWVGAGNSITTCFLHIFCCWLCRLLLSSKLFFLLGVCGSSQSQWNRLQQLVFVNYNSLFLLYLWTVFPAVWKPAISFCWVGLLKWFVFASTFLLANPSPPRFFSVTGGKHERVPRDVYDEAVRAGKVSNWIVVFCDAMQECLRCGREELV